MRGGGRHGRSGESSRRRLAAILITLILLAMIGGLAAGLVASLAHLKRGQQHDARVHAGSHVQSPERAKRA
jgi:hypothetical protein